MAKKIIWSSGAKKELKKTLEFYSQRNKSNTYSLKLLEEVEDLTKTLAKSEFIGRLTSNKLQELFQWMYILCFTK